VDEYWDYGIYTIPSDRHVIARVNRVAEWLRLDPLHEHPLSGEIAEEPSDPTEDWGFPHIFIFSNCTNLVEHLPPYQWKPKPPSQEADPKEEPLGKDDHDVDALGYGLMTRPSPAEAPKAQARAMDARSQKYYELIQKKRLKQEGKRRGHSRLGAMA
jgi:hypothetical protein